MTSIVRQYDPKTGKTYAVESTAKWDKEKKMSVPHRKVIGHFDEETGEIIPNRQRKKGEKRTVSAKSAGCTILFDEIVERIGLLKILKEVFPDKWDKLLTCAYYLLSEGNALSHCEEWSQRTTTPLGDKFPSQRIYDVIADIDSGAQMEFFTKWAQKVSEDEYYALDITSISSYSKLIKSVKYGHNRDGESLPQINLGMLVGIKTGLPVYFHTYPGSIHDVSTLKKNLKYFEWIGYRCLHLVMDRGFCSKANISELYEGKFKFLIALPKTLKFTRDAIDEVRNTIRRYSHRLTLEKDHLYVSSSLKEWEGHRCYTHVYFNDMKAAVNHEEFYQLIDRCMEELKSGTKNPDHQKLYDQFFIIERKQRVGKVISVNDEAVEKYLDKYAGFSVIISNDVKDPVKALEIYRTKDRVEKTFDNLKGDLDGKRIRAQSDLSMDGKLFIQFLGLILASYIQETMRAKEMYRDFTMQSLIEEMKILMEVRFCGKRNPQHSELTANQRKIVEPFGLQIKGACDKKAGN